ncbi:UDP-glycosyltransferase 83A1 [Vigna radiata var. radiata]|uniref:UDP-glycosyltransferase 83A1 n=1 Tax=Vigna radiata var. radiata TaxID=3916 RepID=A0A1S3TTA8_VIGRR|nr:UDP-glycosyltransferase 83A1 [Vigna radiata var. radiata]
MGIPHFLAIPFPIQGHINPLLQFSQLLVTYGCKITFLSSDDNYRKLKAAGHGKAIHPNIKFVSLPDGVDPQDDRKDQANVISTTIKTMRVKLPMLIQDVNALDSHNKISCIIVTKNMGWALEVGHQLGIKGALFWPASATSLTSFNSIQRLIDEGTIDSKTGLPTRNHELIQLASNLPLMEAAAMPWYCLGNAFFFLHMKQEMQNLNLAEKWLCNTTFDLEAGAFSTSPKLLPTGPLMANENNILCSLWEEDRTCLEWLDLQPPQSVIYVSFGSMVSLKPNQFNELALGLDLLKRPFLWVVREDNGFEVNDACEFRGSQGKVVSWAPQKKVLSHPSIACFISHCGWNSTIEGVYNGVPFLCWPFCSDQFMNQTYICDVWKVGVGFDRDENGLISKEEIKKKVEQLLVDEEIKERSSKLMEMIIKNKTQGDQNLNMFINWAKD